MGALREGDPGGKTGHDPSTWVPFPRTRYRSRSPGMTVLLFRFRFRPIGEGGKVRQRFFRLGLELLELHHIVDAGGEEFLGGFFVRAGVVEPAHGGGTIDTSQ